MNLVRWLFELKVEGEEEEEISKWRAGLYGFLKGERERMEERNV